MANGPFGESADTNVYTSRPANNQQLQTTTAASTSDTSKASPFAAMEKETYGVSSMTPWTGTNPFNPEGFQSSVDWSQFGPGGQFGDGGGGGGPDTSTDHFSGIKPFEYAGPQWSDVQVDKFQAPDAVDPLQVEASQVEASLVEAPDPYTASQFGGAETFGYEGFDPQMDQFSYDQFQAPDPAMLQNDPGYQFRLQQGQKAIERSAAARGSLNTGGTLQGLMDYGQNMASQEYQNAYNRSLGEYQMGYGQATSEHDREYARRMGEHQQGLSQAQNTAQFNEANRYRDWAANEQANQFGAQLNAANMLQAGGMNQAAQMQAGGMNQAAQMQAQLANQGANLQAGLASNQMALNAAQLNQQGALQAGALNQAGQFGEWDRGMLGYQTGYDYSLQDAYRQQDQANAAKSAAAAGARGDRNWAYQMAQDQYGRDQFDYGLSMEEFLMNRDMQYDRPMQMSEAGLRTG